MHEIDPFSKNLKHIEVVNQLTQKEVADRIPVSVSQYSKVCTGKQMPSISFVLGVEKAFGISLDSLLHVDLEEEAKRKSTTYGSFDQRYQGCYMVYYHDSNLYDKYFAEFVEKDVELKAGILVVRKDDVEKSKLKISLWMGYSRERAKIHYEQIKKFGKSMATVCSYLMSTSRSCDIFEGTAIFTEDYVQFDLTEQTSGSKALITLHNMREGTKYKAGLGTLSMSLEGRASTLRYIGISDMNLTCAEDDISRHLMMENENIDFSLINEAVVEIMEKSEDIDGSIDKQLVISNEIFKLIKRILRSKTCRPAGVTEIENRRWCHFVEGEMKNSHVKIA